MSIGKDGHGWKIVFRRDTNVVKTNEKAVHEFKGTNLKSLFENWMLLTMLSVMSLS